MVTATIPATIEPAIRASDQSLLTEAFSSFTHAAASLERSYLELQLEVARLRRELADSNHSLEESLTENQRMRKRLDRILESLPCGVVVVEDDGRISLANKEAELLLGLERDLDMPQQLLSVFESVPEGGSELEVLGNGVRRWTAVRCAGLLNGQHRSSIFIVQDISEIKKLEQQQEVVRRRQALADMSTTLAHEIRNPLGSLELFAGLLAASQLGEEEHSWVRQVQAGLRTLAATVNNVLHFHSQPHPEMMQVNLGDLLDSVGAFLAPQAEAKKITLKISHTLGQTVLMADRHRLAQVVMNIGLNAFHFTPPGGVVTISGQAACGTEQSAARIRIEDTGPGIPEEDLERIFEAGYTTCSGSPGLGLAVCRTIVEQHGGSIVALPQNTGASFQLDFPAARIAE